MSTSSHIGSHPEDGRQANRANYVKTEFGDIKVPQGYRPLQIGEEIPWHALHLDKAWNGYSWYGDTFNVSHPMAGRKVKAGGRHYVCLTLDKKDLEIRLMEAEYKLNSPYNRDMSSDLQCYWSEMIRMLKVELERVVNGQCARCGYPVFWEGGSRGNGRSICRRNGFQCDDHPMPGREEIESGTPEFFTTEETP